jgi:L-lactate dehydrogenase complex protein LldG
MSNNSREKILSKIRQALTSKVPVPFEGSSSSENIFFASTEELEIEFAENFTKLQGRFCFCNSFEEVVANLNELSETRKWNKLFCVENTLKERLNTFGCSNIISSNLHDCDASITTCESLVARTGSILLSSASESGRTVSVYAPVHICIATTSQLVYDLKDSLKQITSKYGNKLPSLITLATGPSRTADIEKTLVVGVHGPKEVFCFLIDS